MFSSCYFLSESFISKTVSLWWWNIFRFHLKKSKPNIKYWKITEVILPKSVSEKAWILLTMSIIHPYFLDLFNIFLKWDRYQPSKCCTLKILTVKFPYKRSLLEGLQKLSTEIVTFLYCILKRVTIANNFIVDVIILYNKRQIPSNFFIPSFSFTITVTYK